jgi:alanine dehydrogenase
MIDNEVVKKVLTMRECIEAQERAFAGMITGTSLSWPRLDTFVPCDREDGYYRFGTVEGASDGFYAVRLKSDIITWPKRADGSHSELKYCMRPGIFCGLVMLFSSRDGEPLAIMNDGHLQHMRVGGAAGIGTKLLARSDARTVGVIGSGGMARSLLEALQIVRDIRKVKVFSRTPENARRYADEMGETLGLDITPVATAREAVRGVDILATATDTMTPVVETAWLEAGMHVVAIGPKDLPSDVETRIDWMVRQGTEDFDMPETGQFRKGVGHSRSAFVGGTPEQQKRLPIKTKTPKDRDWPLYADVVSGRAPGRTTSDQITRYRPVGNWGIQFSSCGAVVYRKAKEQGLGHKLPTEWFLQNIKN